MSTVYIGPYLRFPSPVTEKVRTRSGCPVCKREWVYRFCPDDGTPIEQIEIKCRSVDRTWQGFENKDLSCLALEGDGLRDKEVVYLYGVRDGNGDRKFWWNYTYVNHSKSWDLQATAPLDEIDWFRNKYQDEIKRLTRYFGQEPSFHWGIVEPLV